MLKSVFISVALVFLTVAGSFGQTQNHQVQLPTLSAEVIKELSPLKNNVRTFYEASENKIIDVKAANRAIEQYMNQAKQIAGRDISVSELLAIDDSPVPLTRAQKIVGLMSFVNIMWVAAILIGVVSFVWLFGSWVSFLLQVLVMIPMSFYEVLLYVLSLILIVYGDHFRPGVGHYVALTGCLLFAGAMIFTYANRRLRNSEFSFFAVLSIVWGVTAVLYSSVLIGFFTVVAVMSALGFFVAIHPLCYVIGFKDEDAVGRGTVAAFCLLITFVGMRIFNIHLPRLSVFESGALFMGSFVGYLGLLIASSRWYPRNYPWALFQLVTIVAGIGALLIGSVYQISELQKIGGTFFSLYLLEKFCEIPVNSRNGYAYLGLFVSALIYGFCVVVKNNPATFGPFLPF